MGAIKAFAFAMLVFIPVLASAEDRVFTVYVGGCEDADISADVVYAADQNFNDLKNMKVNIIVDEKRKRCGYGLRKGKQIKQLNSGLTDIDLNDEVRHFFESRK